MRPHLARNRNARPYILRIVELLLPCASIASARAAKDGVPRTELTHKCSRGISRAVRKVLEKEVLQPAERAGLEEWPKDCVFDPSMDLYGQHERQKSQDRRAPGKPWICGYTGKAFKSEHYLDLHLERRFMNETPPDGVCLADYCEVFEVCHGETWRPRRHRPSECNQEELLRVRHLCENALNKCLPLDQEATRSLHGELSRQYCQGLDCRIREERRRAREAEDIPTVVYIIMVMLVGLMVFTVVLGCIHAGDCYKTKDATGPGTPAASRPARSKSSKASGKDAGAPASMASEPTARHRSGARPFAD